MTTPHTPPTLEQINRALTAINDAMSKLSRASCVMAGDDKLRPRWMTSYPKEGKQEDGETLKLELPAAMFPPGSRVTIEVPCCPKCGEPADMNGDDRKPHRNWPRCDCGFSWTEFAKDNYA